MLKFLIVIGLLILFISYINQIKHKKYVLYLRNISTLIFILLSIFTNNITFEQKIPLIGLFSGLWCIITDYNVSDEDDCFGLLNGLLIIMSSSIFTLLLWL